MRRSVFWNFIAGYLFFAIMGFLVITFNTFDSISESILDLHGKSNATYAQDIAKNLPSDILSDSRSNELESSFLCLLHPIHPFGLPIFMAM